MNLKKLLFDYGGMAIVIGGGSVVYDWYVDSVSGNDANTGKSAAQAFATIAPLETVLLAGDSVGLANGSHWREQLDWPSNGGKIQTYGTGNRPLLDASNIASNASFAKTGGYTNIYQIDVTCNLASADGYTSFWENDVRFTRAADLATCDATPGTYISSADTGSGDTVVTFQIHSFASDNPTTNGKTYEYSARQFGFNGLDISGLQVTGIHTRRQTGNCSLRVGPNSICRDCRASEGTKHNFFVDKNCQVFSCEADEMQFLAGYAATLFVAHDSAEDGTSIVYFEDCHGWMTDFNALYSAFFGHSDPSNMLRATFVNCRATNMGVGFGASVDNFVATGCVSDECTTGYNFAGSAPNITLTDCQHINGVLAGYAVALNHASILICTIDGLIAQINGGSSRVVGITAITANCDLDIQNSTLEILAPNVGTRYGVVCLNSTGSIYSRNNHWINLDLQYEFGANNPTIDSDNNVFNTSSRWRKGGTIYATLAGWQTATGQDANSTVG